MIMRFGRRLAVAVATLGLVLATGASPASADGYNGCTWDDDGMLIHVICDGDEYEVIISCYNQPPLGSGVISGHLDMWWRCSSGIESIQVIKYR